MGTSSAIVTCLGCGHVATVERGDTPLTRLTKRLVCSVCGSRAVKAQADGAPTGRRHSPTRAPGSRPKT